jgi:hypothetical protein
VPSITARCRPFFSQPPRAFYRNAGVWDDAAADAMRVSAAEKVLCCSCAHLLLWFLLLHAYAWMHACMCLLHGVLHILQEVLALDQ